MAFRGWRAERAHVKRRVCGPSSSYGPILLHALTAGLVQQEGSARLTKKKNPAVSKPPPNPSLQPGDLSESCRCRRQRQECPYGRDGSHTPCSDGFKSLGSCLLPSAGVRKREGRQQGRANSWGCHRKAWSTCFSALHNRHP